MNGNIYIPKPCHENWNKMTPDEKGRHCAVCSKVVTDFTKMKTEEIATSIQNSEKDVCGRININQLTPTNKKQQFYFWMKGTLVPKTIYTVLALFGLAAIFKKSAYGQALPGQITIVNGGAKYEAPATQKKKVNIEVVNEFNKPVINATVQIINQENTVSDARTNKFGMVSGEIEMAQIGYSFIDVIVNAHGYEPKELKGIRISKNGQTIRVKLDENVIMMGKMAYYEEPETLTVKEVKLDTDEPIIGCNTNVQLLPINEISQPPIRDINFLPESEITTVDLISMLDVNPKEMAFVSFPNPTLGDVTIETKQDESFNIQVYNENGVMVLQETNQYKRTLIHLQDYASGIYFALIFVNNKAIETHKIILVK